MTKLRKRKLAEFERLSEKRRREFVENHRGFLQDVVRLLEHADVRVSLPTVSRTWYSQFRQPNRNVVTMLDFEYGRVQARDAVRLEREGAEPPPLSPIAAA